MGNFSFSFGNENYTIDEVVNSVGKIRKILEAAETDIMTAMDMVFEELGAGSLIQQYSIGSQLLANVINNMANILTAYGGEILEKLAILGIIDNKCATKIPLSIRRPILARLFLSELFNMLNCYGMSGVVDKIMDALDPLREVVIVPARIDDYGEYIEEQTEMVRSGNNVELIAQCVTPLLCNNISENIEALINYGICDYINPDDIDINSILASNLGR